MIDWFVLKLWLRGGLWGFNTNQSSGRVQWPKYLDGIELSRPGLQRPPLHQTGIELSAPWLLQIDECQFKFFILSPAFLSIKLA